MRVFPTPFLSLALTVLMVGAVLSLSGCGDSADYDAASTAANNAPAKSPAPEAKAPAADPAPVETERVKAAVGVGIKGRSLDGYKDGIEGAIASPAQALFSTKEKIAYEFAVKHALDLYQATHGNLPQTHEDFMRDIIKMNKIDLPELPPGHKYVFDPEQGQLMVERPKQN